MTKQDNDATAEVITQFGQDNLAAILEVYRAFADSIDYRKVVDWSIKQPLDDLLLPLFLRAVVEIAGRLDLGKTQAELEMARTLRIDATSVRAAIDPEVHTPAKVRAYLAANGWRQTDPIRDYWNRRDVTVAVPQKPTAPDYTKRLAMYVQTIATVHETGELGVLAGIAATEPEAS